MAIPGTDWSEPILLWVAVGMPTGSGKSSLFKYLLSIIQKVRSKKGLNNSDPSWQLEEATFEKMGVMMSQNHSKLLGLYDELSTFLTQINLYRGRALSDSHDLALFLQLYNGHPWTRSTGKIHAQKGLVINLNDCNFHIHSFELDSTCVFNLIWHNNIHTCIHI